MALFKKKKKKVIKANMLATLKTKGYLFYSPECKLVN